MLAAAHVLLGGTACGTAYVLINLYLLLCIQGTKDYMGPEVLIAQRPDVRRFEEGAGIG